MNYKNTKMKRKMYLIFSGRFPSEKAASAFTAKNCETFARQDLEVCLIVPRRISGRVKKDVWEYYNIRKNFKIVYLPTIDLFNVPILKNIAYYTNAIIFSIFVVLYLLFKNAKKDIVYSNETLPLLCASFFFSNTVFELHDFPEKKKLFYATLFRRVKWILAHNQWKKRELKKQFDILGDKIFYEPNAVAIEEFDISISKNEARKKLNLPLDKKIVVYTGHLYKWKGVDTLAHTTKKLKEDTYVYFVGGTKPDIERFSKRYDSIRNIRIIGHRPHIEIPLWQKAADVLVLPNTAKEKISKYYTSPMKLFEYMASKRTIVASEIPSITELLNKSNSVLVKPDDVESLQLGIETVLDNTAMPETLSEQAFKDVQKHSWEKRASRIINIIS